LYLPYFGDGDRRGGDAALFPHCGTDFCLRLSNTGDIGRFVGLRLSNMGDMGRFVGLRLSNMGDMGRFVGLRLSNMGDMGRFFNVRLLVSCFDGFLSM
jgi:hypothetical protein